MKVINQAFVLIFCAILTLTSSQNRPNIVIIIADDMGWNDVGFHGSNQIPTPNIDALAYNGVILNRFYTLPICTPSRTALLTGQYPIRAGLQGSPIVAGQNRYLPLNIPTLPEKLKELGYSTNLVGKWHLGASSKNVTPTHRGFDHHFGYWQGFMDWFTQQSLGEEGMIGLDLHDDSEPMWKNQGEYATSLFTRKALEIIGAHNKSKPLFLTVAHLATHAGIYDDLQVPDLTENDKNFGYIKDEMRRLLAGTQKLQGVINELDKSVGAIVDALSRKGILDNTIVIFISDNGAPTEGTYANRGSNWPLRGLKFSLHDGGVRNIAVMYSSLLKNKVNNELIHITDLMPTLYVAAGGEIKALGKIDGKNQWPTLTSNKKSPRTEILLNIDEILNLSGLIGEKGRYKIINGSTTVDSGYDGFFGESGRDCSIYNTEAVLQSVTNHAIGGKLTHGKILQLRGETDLGNCRDPNKELTTCAYNNYCLFDLWKDPCEMTNIAEDFPEILGRLRRRLEEYWREMVPQQVADIDARANPIYCNNTWFTWLDGCMTSSPMLR